MSERVIVEIEGQKCEVIDRIGWVHSAGVYVIEVKLPGGELVKAVRPTTRSAWRFWKVADRLGAGQGGATDIDAVVAHRANLADADAHSD